MSILIDTGVFYAHHDQDATRHEAAVAAIDAILDGEFGQPYTTEYILDETITLTRRRTGSFTAAKTVGDRILGRDSFPEVFELLYVGRDGVAETLDVWERYHGHSLSFTDAATIALATQEDIDMICSFDSDFDGLVDRRDPTTLA